MLDEAPDFGLKSRHRMEVVRTKEGGRGCEYLGS